MPENKGFKYAYSVGQIDDIFEKMRNTGRPDKLTIGYVQNTWVLKNAQYSAIIDILKAMQFLTSDGTPTDLYGEFQNKNLAKKAIAKGTRNAYPTLFKAYPNAQNLSKDDLEGYLKQQTGADASVVSKIYGTIKRLMSLADFDGDVTEDRKDPVHKPNAGSNHINSIPITMNIQIVIPNDATPEQYDVIFSSIKKNLLG